MWIGLLFVTLAAISVAGAMLFPPWGYLLLWPGLSCLLVASAYWGLGAGILGKRATGEIPWWSWIVFGPYLAGFYLINAWAGVWRRNVRGIDDWTLVAPGLVLARIPNPAEAPADLAAVIDMTCEYAAPAWPAGILYLTRPTLDNMPPRAEEVADLVRQVRPVEGSILIHCAGGNARSAIVMAALFVDRGLASDGPAALAMLKALRPSVHPTAEQLAVLDEAVQLLQADRPEP
jgi:hypothetical protein